MFCVFLTAERPSLDEEDLYMILQKCLALRENYVFREEVAPWEKEVITDPSTPKPNPNPFAYVLEQKTDVSFICQPNSVSFLFQLNIYISVQQMLIKIMSYLSMCSIWWMGWFMFMLIKIVRILAEAEP